VNAYQLEASGSQDEQKCAKATKFKMGKEALGGRHMGMPHMGMPHMGMPHMGMPLVDRHKGCVRVCWSMLECVKVCWVSL